MSEFSVEITPLSLLAEFDDINRCNNVLNDGATEEYFIRFLELCESWQRQYSVAECEVSRLQKELQDALKAISAWEAKFTHARKLLDAEKRQRVKAETERDALEKQMCLARDLLFSDNREKLNNETLEKLAFLNNTSRHVSHHDVGAPRLNTISERVSMDSTGNLLSDQSFSRSEDDLDESVVNGRRSWRRHRPSAVMPSYHTEDHPPNKKRRSSGTGSDKKSGEYCHDGAKTPNGALTSSNSSNNGGRVVATTTVTVDRCNPNCSGGGRITASSVIEGIPSNGGSDSDAKHGKPEPATPKPTNQEYNIKIESRGDGFYNTNIKNFAPSAPPLKPEAENTWGTPSLLAPTVSSPRANVRMRQHTFVGKTIIRPEPCTTCGNRIRFAKAVVKCSDCRAVCHVECKERLPLPCVPSHYTPTNNANNHIGTISDYAPNVSPMIPALIIHCVNEVESRGLTEVGLYRVPGSEKEVKALKERFMRGKGTPPLGDIDINVICGCVKDFLRSLKEPLVTHSLWSDFVTATELEDNSDRQAALYQTISELPQPNRDTLAFMMLHLQRIAECVDCKMPIENLAKVFGPTIVGYSDSDPEPNYMYKQTLQQFKVMECLLETNSDYWARIICSSDPLMAASSVSTPPATNVLRTPSLRPRLSTVPQSAATPRSTFARQTPRTESTKSTVTSASSKKGFFYTPISDRKGVQHKNRKYYEPHRLQLKNDQGERC